MIYISVDSLYVRNENKRLHIIDIEDGMFSVEPRTDGTIVPKQKLKSLSIIDGEITLTGDDDLCHTYSLIH